MIYVNNAATSWPKPAPVLEAVRHTMSTPPSAHLQLLEDAASTVGGVLGIEDRGNLLFTPGCTAALELALTSLPWQEGDVIVTSALEHEALLRAVAALAPRGVVHRVVLPTAHGPFDLAQLRHLLEHEPVRWVAVTAASNVSGDCLPVAEIVQLCQDNSTRVLVDAAQIAGLLPVPRGDLVVAAGHKGPLGPQGVGFLWAAADVEFAGGTVPGYCASGSANLAGVAGLQAGLSWLQARDVNTRDLALRLAHRLRGRLPEVPGLRVVGFEPESDEFSLVTATVSVVLDGCSIDQIEGRMADSGVVMRSGKHCAAAACAALGEPAGTARFSFGPFNRPSDVDVIIDVLMHLSTGR